MGLLEGKNILSMGVRNKWSIAWGISEKALKEGANLIFTCQSEREKEETICLLEGYGKQQIYICDVTSDQDLDELFNNIKSKYETLDGVIHSIAYAKPQDMQNSFINTSRDGFIHSLNISTYSLIAVSQRAKELMSEGGSIITLTFIGAKRVINGYNMMGVAKAALEASVIYLASDLGPLGIRVNAISAGAIKTASAKGVKSFISLNDTIKEKVPLKRGITLEDIGKSAIYLLSGLSSGVTGEILHVDCGYNIRGI